MAVANEYTLTLSCKDRPGIVSAISSSLHENGFNICTSTQYSDPDTAGFFMRVTFECVSGDTTTEAIKQFLKPHIDRFDMTLQLFDPKKKPRVLIMVSKFDHCLVDLLYRYRIGALDIEIPAIVSNHRDCYQTAAAQNIPFHHLPITKETKAAQEKKLLEIIRDEHIDLVVLARYMQVLSADLCEALAGRAINIHHSFLPSFKGARPYQRAHERGVKLIGATAHYVTSDLDEGPIIEQEVARVSHAMTADELVAVGRDIERVTLFRAVRAHVERRVFINGIKTVVLPN